MEENVDYGVVYALSNRLMPGLVKIGITLRGDVEKRMKELYSTGVPVPFKCEYACKVQPSRCREIEKALHEAFADYRVNENREFFAVDSNKVVGLLRVISPENITGEVAEKMDVDTGVEEKVVEENTVRVRRPNLDYEKMGIQIGDVLVYVENPEITVKYAGDRKVEYAGERVSLTVATQKIRQTDAPLQPTGYWSFNGRNLKEIYEEVFPLLDE